MEKNIVKLVNKLQFISIKMQIFHWNVTGKDFLSYHAFFESAYNELNNYKDLLAEFLRYKKEIAMIDFAEISNLGKGFKLPKEAEGMLKEMLADYTSLMTDFTSFKKDEVLDSIISTILPELEKRIFLTQSIIM